MKRHNQPRNTKRRQQAALEYWKKQLSKATRSETCKSTDEYIKDQIARLTAKTTVTTQAE